MELEYCKCIFKNDCPCNWSYGNAACLTIKEIQSAYIDELIRKLSQEMELIDEFYGYDNGKLTLSTRTIIPAEKALNIVRGIE